MDTLSIIGLCLTIPGVVVLGVYLVILIIEFIKTVAECIKNEPLAFAIIMAIILIAYVIGVTLICISYYL